MENARKLRGPAYNDLAATMAEALGFQAGQGLFVVRHLTEADEIGGQVYAEGAVKILIALAGNLDLSAPQKTVSRFWDLPITQFLVGDFTPYGEQTASIPLDDIYVSMFLKHLGYSFGEFLANTIQTYSVLDQTTVQPMSLNLGGGPGKTWAKFSFLIAGEPERLTIPVFGSTPHHGIPDDAPIARLERHASVPCEIFPILRMLLTGKRDGPELVHVANDGAALIAASETALH